MKKNKSFGESLSHAFSGLIDLLKKERNARFHLLATILVLVVSALVRLNMVEWLFIILAIFCVWIAEAFNTSLEKLFDLVEPDENNLVKTGKDLSAAAVLLTAIMSIVIGILVLGPPLYGAFTAFLKGL